MKVSQLVEVLKSIQDQDAEVLFSYDSRVCTCRVNVVDFSERDAEVILRNEDQGEYDFNRYIDDSGHLKTLVADFSADEDD